MKIGMTSLTLRNEKVENVIKYAKTAGLCGIEWGVSDLHMPLCDSKQAEKIKALSKENDIEVFSLGSYCKMLEREEIDKTIETAAMLGAPIIRIWAGEKSPHEADGNYKQQIIYNTVYMAEKAKAYGIHLGFEYHKNTLTETAESALDLIKRINCDNVGLYWQPDGMLSSEENLKNLIAVKPYITGNLHVHNYRKETGYQPLENIADSLSLYYNDIKDMPYNLMIEFVKDSIPENIKADADTLRKIIMQ